MLSRTLACIVALALAGCSQTPPPPAKEPVATTRVTRAALTTVRGGAGAVSGVATLRPASARAVEAPRPGPPMAARYRRVVEDNPALRGVDWEHVSVDQDGGHVTLRGLLPTVADKVQLELAIRQLADVESVTNEIQTLPR